ncbi:GNAT family N-acetyltransferase [Shewanella surugensis]|uniref:GNAT family N-acetyltransferase n=1 Tax=Shewanella surugensis TaxID=212020 RepID=A0ABT0LC04_9GAMM|nr:GNAT family N-acetyltransferase [Shewanella surugensis]MCL1125040.1 GNAT family N-acetyltransferase [Shewanella surugensis]
MKIITQTPRLIIREFDLDDVQAVYDFNAPKEVNLYTGDAGMCESLEDAKNIITDIWLKEYQTIGFGRWAVVLKETGDVIGFCGFKQETRIDEVDIGYRFHPDFWGKGFATEANLACIEYAKQHMPLDLVVGDAVADNQASINVLQKLGMHFVKELQESDWLVHRYSMNLK